jgi:hypothetical protein
MVGTRTNLGPPGLRASRTRGSAIVEMLLATPFFVLCLLLIFDFTNAYSERRRVQAAARHAAWGADRVAAPAVPLDAAGLAEIHWEPGAQPLDLLEVDRESKSISLTTTYGASIAVPGTDTPQALVEQAAGPHEAFLSGQVALRTAEAARDVGGTSRVFASGLAGAEHIVLPPGEVEPPDDDPHGWVDVAGWTWWEIAVWADGLSDFLRGSSP